MTARLTKSYCYNFKISIQQLCKKTPTNNFTLIVKQRESGKNNATRM